MEEYSCEYTVCKSYWDRGMFYLSDKSNDDSYEKLRKIVSGDWNNPIKIKLLSRDNVSDAWFKLYNRNGEKLPVLYYNESKSNVFKSTDEGRNFRLRYMKKDMDGMPLFAIDFENDYSKPAAVQVVEKKKVEMESFSFQFNEDEFKNLLEEKKRLLFDYLTQFASNEYNVKAHIIDPILDKLGWTFPNHRHYEVVCKGNGNGCRADYALCLNSQYRYVIEAKAIDKNLDDKKSISQVYNYISNTHKFSNAIGILTNGFEWRIYDCWGNEARLLIRTDITDDKFIEVAKLIAINKDKDEIRNHEYSKSPVPDHFDHPADTKIVVKNRDNIIIHEGDGTAILREFISERLTPEQREELTRDGSFDRPVITKDKYDFQRDLGYVGNDVEDYYITKDYAVSFKYLIIKQIINKFNLDYIVEYINNN